MPIPGTFRHEDTSRPWAVEERITLWARRVCYAADFGSTSFGSTLAILAGMAWTGRFLLARIRTGAKRGIAKPEKEEIQEIENAIFKVGGAIVYFNATLVETLPPFTLS